MNLFRVAVFSSFVILHLASACEGHSHDCSCWPNSKWYGRDKVLRSAQDDSFFETLNSLHVSFTPAQLQQLRQLKFLSQSIRLLPAWLSASAIKRQQRAPSMMAGPDNDELMEYVLAGLAASRAEFGKPAYLVLQSAGSGVSPRRVQKYR
ncbi:hypothetical protein GCM10022408_34100 [Hymenobacter fastidiosus]|uniref:Uncharacterized protein n=1 Tax=Hymenobacter fastidiosus TaxID=486264 RepID=A0ABP7SXK2_9BACT